VRSEKCHKRKWTASPRMGRSSSARLSWNPRGTICLDQGTRHQGRARRRRQASDSMALSERKHGRSGPEISRRGQHQEGHVSIRHRRGLRWFGLEVERSSGDSPCRCNTSTQFPAGATSCTRCEAAHGHDHTFRRAPDPWSEDPVVVSPSSAFPYPIGGEIRCTRCSRRTADLESPQSWKKSAAVRWRELQQPRLGGRHRIRIDSRHKTPAPEISWT
jgi:hypothetical protein